MELEDALSREFFFFFFSFLHRCFVDCGYGFQLLRVCMHACVRFITCGWMKRTFLEEVGVVGGECGFRSVPFHLTT